MAKNREWLIYVRDIEGETYDIIGPVDAHIQPEWIEAIQALEDEGREILFQEIDVSAEKEAHLDAKRKGLTRAHGKIVPPPRDTSSDVKGALPKYAANADRAKLVQVLCKGDCRATRWAEMNKSYPGKAELKSAAHGIYRARCLKCGREALDNYNWMRSG